ncbi:MAG: DNA translocase FtsK [Acidobacterium ailaaui]|nr:DNA translocase FtsK [Pseudacidobacterium ailaaui]
MRLFDLIERRRLKSRLRRAFYNAGLYVKYRSGDREIPVYPQIHSALETPDKIEYVFTLKNGMDPKEVTKKEYVFKQVFGRHVELKGDYKRFVLTVFKHDFPKRVKYDYTEVFPLIAGMAMPIVCGKDRYGNWLVYDAVNNPNCLLFGQPGSGKSSMLHNILVTLIQYYSANELHLYLGDLKMAEFGIYEGVKHVKNVSFLAEELAPAFRYIKEVEMKKRGKLLKKYRVRHISKVPATERPPFIVVCVDEFVMIKDDKIMTDLLQIASLGRACGIFVILSMQRPSHTILSTDVRAVLSVRMGFRTVDLKNAMMGETPGSEKISVDSPGRFLLRLDDLIELKAPYISEDEAERILEKYKSDAWKNNSFEVKPATKSEEITLGVLDDAFK